MLDRAKSASPFWGVAGSDDEDVVRWRDAAALGVRVLGAWGRRAPVVGYAQELVSLTGWSQENPGSGGECYKWLPDGG